MGSPWPLAVTAVGFTPISPYSQYPPTQGHPQSRLFDPKVGRKLTHYQIVYITEGSGYFESESTGKIQLRAGDVFILFPGIWHCYAPQPSTGWTEAWIEVGGSGIELLVAKKLLSPDHCVKPLADNTRVVEAIHECLDLLKYQPRGFEGLAAAAALRVLAEISASKETAPSKNSRMEKAVRLARLALASELRSTPGLESLARRLRISYSQLRREFRRATGMSLKEYHERLRLRAVTQSLSSGQLKLEALAEQFGYSSAFHLSKNFKKHLGLSPSEWRARHSA